MTIESATGDQIETDRPLIEAELQRLLKQKKFSAAAQMSAFLRYIVTQTLDGKGDRIKAYTVGVDALGKPETFDAQNDPSVRVLALRLRKCLNACYEHDHDLQHARIVLKVGTYVPEFLKAGYVSGELESETLSARTTASDTQPGSKPVEIGSAHQLAENSAHYDQSSAFTGERVTGEHVTGENFTSEPVTGEREKDQVPKAPLRGSSLLISGMLLLVVAGWTVSASRNDSFAQQVAVSVPDLHMASVSPRAVSDEVTMALQETTRLLDSVPTLYLPGNGRQSQLVKQVLALLGSAVVQQGHVDVVHVSRIVEEKRISVPGYWMIIDEIQLDSRPTLVAQLLRQDSGAVVMSKTLTLDSSNAGFTREDMHWIEVLAGDVSDAQGPLFLDYCADTSARAADRCPRITEM